MMIALNLLGPSKDLNYIYYNKKWIEFNKYGAQSVGLPQIFSMQWRPLKIDVLC